MSDALSHALDLTAVHPREASRPSSLGRTDRLEPDAAQGTRAPLESPEELVRLRSALEDIVALAHSSASATQRVVQMQRRAIASLTGLDQRR